MHCACSGRPYQIILCNQEILRSGQNCYMIGSIYALKRHCQENTTHVFVKELLLRVSYYSALWAFPLCWPLRCDAVGST